MAAAFPVFHVSPNGYTFLLDGRPVTSLSYPALAFEEYLPLLALGVTAQAAVWTNIAAWALGAVVLYAVLPRKLAPLAAVVVSLDVFTGYAVGGVTDFLFIPLLIGAAAGWDQFAWTRGRAAWRGPVLMGLAMAVKQTPWLVLPFVIIGIALESRRLRDWTQGLRDGLRYLAIAVPAFLVPNLPYLLNSPSGWLRGVLTPITAHTVPAGQGLISLSLSLPVGGGSLRDYNSAARGRLPGPAGLLRGDLPGAEAGRVPPPVDRAVLRHPVLRQLPGHADPGRDRGGGDHPAPAAGCSWRHWKWVAAGAVGACALAVLAALTSPSPLAMSIESVRTTGQLATVDQVTVSVTNNSGHSVRPSFTVAGGPDDDGLLAPGARSRRSWARTSTPGTRCRPRATSRRPRSPTASRSWPSRAGRHGQPDRDLRAERCGGWCCGPPRSTSPWRGARRSPCAPRSSTASTSRSGRRTCLSTSARSFTPRAGRITSQAFINTGLGGRHPVSGADQCAGRGRVHHQVAVVNNDPVYFEANLVKSGSAYPYGYSPILAVRFRK